MSRNTRQHGQDKRKGCTRGRVIPFAERAPVGRHTLSGAPIKYDQAAAELGVAGALGGWAPGRKGALSANYSILCKTLCNLAVMNHPQLAEKVPVPGNPLKKKTLFTKIEKVGGTCTLSPVAPWLRSVGPGRSSGRRPSSPVASRVSRSRLSLQSAAGSYRYGHS